MKASGFTYWIVHQHTNTEFAAHAILIYGLVLFELVGRCCF